MEPLLYVWSILITISFAGWVIADSEGPKKSAVIALMVSFIPFIISMLKMLQFIIAGGPTS